MISTDTTLHHQLDIAIKDEFSRHEEECEPFLDYLTSIRQNGLVESQFEAFRANYFFRTHTTIESICKVVAAAARNGDANTLADAGKNLFEETGEGSAEKTHLSLLEWSHNFHGDRLFGLSPLRICEADSSPWICEEARLFRRKQNELYQSDYPVVLATAFAHETAADPMLNLFYESFFVPYRDLYSSQEFAAVSEYFLTHTSGLEQAHGEMAKTALQRVCQTEEDLILVVTAIRSFLGIQASLWSGILQQLRACASL